MAIALTQPRGRTSFKPCLPNESPCLFLFCSNPRSSPYPSSILCIAILSKVRFSQALSATSTSSALRFLIRFRRVWLSLLDLPQSFFFKQAEPTLRFPSNVFHLFYRKSFVDSPPSSKPCRRMFDSFSAASECLATAETISFAEFFSPFCLR